MPARVPRTPPTGRDVTGKGPTHSWCPEHLGAASASALMTAGRVHRLHEGALPHLLSTIKLAATAYPASSCRVSYVPAARLYPCHQSLCSREIERAAAHPDGSVHLFTRLSIIASARAMSRRKGSIGAETSDAIFAAGIRLMAEHGFEAMSLRQLGAEVGVQASSLYNHIPSKQALLYSIMRRYMDALLTSVSNELTRNDDPIDELRRFVDFHVRYHITRYEALIIINQELKSLESETRQEIINLRDNYEKVLANILRRGVIKGSFKIEDVRITTFAIISMLTGIAAWWRPDGRLSVDALVSIHQALVLGAVHAQMGTSTKSKLIKARRRT